MAIAWTFGGNKLRILFTVFSSPSISVRLLSTTRTKCLSIFASSLKSFVKNSKLDKFSDPENHCAKLGSTFRMAWSKWAFNSVVPSLSEVVYQMIECFELERNSATNEDLPKPAGAEITVSPARSIAMSARMDFLDRKLGGSTGGKVRESPTPGITPACFPNLILDGATPKGEASQGEMAT